MIATIEETRDNEHLWNLFEKGAMTAQHDLNSVRLIRLYNGALEAVLGDVYLQSAIRRAEAPKEGREELNIDPHLPRRYLQRGVKATTSSRVFCIAIERGTKFGGALPPHSPDARSLAPGGLGRVSLYLFHSPL